MDIMDKIRIANAMTPGATVLGDLYRLRLQVQVLAEILEQDKPDPVVVKAALEMANRDKQIEVEPVSFDGGGIA